MLKKLIPLFLLILLMTGCGNRKEPIRESGFFLDTVIQITLYDTQDTALLEKCFQLCSRYEQLLSRTISTSDVSRINQAGGRPVEVEPETMALIQKAVSYSELSEGAFDITIAPVSTLWDFKEKKEVPDESKIQAAMEHVDYRQILLDGNQVTLKDPNASIDLGGIAKGYIADKIKAFLVSENVKSALIDLGGNVLTIGHKPDGSSFQIGIQKPFGETNTPLTSVETSGSSVVTSGVYERYFKKDGVLYHHLLNPSTGYPTENDLLSVTILSPDSTDGDALSTACFVLGLDKGMELIQKLPDIEAIFVTKDYQVHKS